MNIDGKTIGRGCRPWVIAELSANHGQSLEKALSTLEAAAAAGADAIKLQTYTPDTMTLDCDRPEFQIKGGLWDGRSLYALYGEAQTPWEWHEALYRRGRELGVTVFSTPFDETAVDFLETLDTPVYKIASFELTHHPLLRRVARTGKPVIMSTGMASVGEMDEAVATLRGAGCRELMLLHCVSGYPTPSAEACLATIPHLSQLFDLPVGLSDHTQDSAVAIAATSLGAVAIEKHFTLRRADGGPDCAFSIEPVELAGLVSAVRTVFEAIGAVNYDIAASEAGNLLFRRSIFATRDIAAGEALTPANVAIIRPGHGLAPKHFDAVVTRRARAVIVRGTPIQWSLLD